MYTFKHKSCMKLPKSGSGFLKDNCLKTKLYMANAAYQLTIQINKYINSHKT